MTNKKFEQANFDPINSTYRQIIKFVNGKTVDGYSKRVGFAEPVDPVNCLTNFILRMYLKGYLRPCEQISTVDYIEYRYNHSYEHIVTCYYDFPDFNPAVIEHQQRLVQWIGQFYTDMNNLSLEKMHAKYHRSGRAAYSHELDINQHGFQSPDHLVRKVLRLFREGNYPPAHIGQFYRQCKEKYFPRLEVSQSQKYDSIVNKFLRKT